MQAVRRWIPIGILAAAFALIAALITAPDAADAADHLDAPALTSPGDDAALDINDLYVFEGAGQNRTVIAVTVSPAAGADAEFANGARQAYSIRIDQDGDAVEDLTYHFRFFGPFFGRQLVVVQAAEGTDAQSLEPTGKLVKLATTDRSVRTPGGGQLFTGLRSDPFFFDLSGFLGTVEGIGEDGLGNDPQDFFTELNTLAIVMETKDSALFDGDAIGVWATTQRRMDGVWTQVDRLGRPAINTVVNSSGPIVGADPQAKNVYNAARPVDDAAFRQGVIDALQAFSALDTEGPYSDAEAGALADVLLPDILTFSKSSPLPAPLNGRGLADDVIDTELRIVTGGDPLGLFPGRDADGGVNSDGVGPHDDYMSSFPYLGLPN
jgi:hypothetical protein